jgi:hypothetical protein
VRVSWIVIILGVYIFATGMVGLGRTGSFTPLYISGALAAVTIWLGWLLSKGIRSARGAAMTWLILNTILLGYMAVGRLPTHPQESPGSALIFGSMALFALVTLLLVWRSQRKRP